MPPLRTRHSWPQLRRKQPIDSDPFAYFVSPSDDRNIYIEGSLTAGIQIGRSRSLPRQHSRKPYFRLEISTSSRSPTARLRRWIERMEKQYFHHYSHHEDPIIEIIEPRPKPEPQPRMEPVVVEISPPVRGRRSARTGSGQRRAGNKGRTPPRRPRVWREPSAEIWSVAEEDEGESKSGLGITV